MRMFPLICPPPLACILACVFVFHLSAAQARAQHQWNELVSIEVLDGGRIEAGRLQAALHLRLAEGWKTYWRAPGEVGIPPHLSWEGARNVADVRIIWPTPHVFDTEGMQTIGYKDELILPIEITLKSPQNPVRLKGRMEIGLCHDICIPVELEFDHHADPEVDRNPLISAALASRPYSAREANVAGVVCRVSPTQSGMKITARIAMPSVGRSELAVIETEMPRIMAMDTKSWREGGELVAETELLPTSENTAIVLDRSALRFTVIGEAHAVDIRGCSADS